MSATATSGTVTVYPVLRVDFNTGTYDDDRANVWTAVSELEVIAWALRAGKEVIVRDDDGLSFRGRVTGVRRARPQRWIVEVDHDLDPL